MCFRRQEAFMDSWAGIGPSWTDSGGYQVYSLAENRKIKEEGVTFRSHIDGSPHLFTPERAVDIQRVIGADIMMAFDECPPYPCDYAYARQSMELTHRWLDRCLARMAETEPLYGHDQMLFPIVQGSTFSDLRKASAHAIAERGAAGNAIGGLSVGRATRRDVCQCGHVHRHPPRGQAPVFDGGGHTCKPPRETSPSESICSTASCPPEMPGMECCSHAKEP